MSGVSERRRPGRTKGCGWAYFFCFTGGVRDMYVQVSVTDYMSKLRCLYAECVSEQDSDRLPSPPFADIRCT